MAQQERVRISDRTKAGIARARAQGKKIGGRQYGWRKQGTVSRVTEWRRRKERDSAA